MQRLAGILERNRLQQKDIAEALGVSRNAVNAWVHGYSVPTGTNLVRLVEFLNASRVQGEPEITERDILGAPDVAPVVAAEPEPEASGR